MRFTVITSPSADDELALTWMSAPDPQEVADASDTIDQLLKHQPLQVGTVFGNDRLLHVSPLEVVYSVSPDDCRVRILRYGYRP
jgi:hypothetical protein